VTVGLAFSIFLLSTSSLAQRGPDPAVSMPQDAHAQDQPPPQSGPGGYGQLVLMPSLPYRDGVAPPPGYHLEEHSRSALVLSGSIVLGTAYLLSAIIGFASDNTDDNWLFIPLFGPFIDMGARNGHMCSIGERDPRCEQFTPEHKFYLALDGVAQTAGSALLLSGFVFPKKEYVSDTYFSPNNGAPRVSSWTVLPQMIPGSRYGLTLLGQLF
jgi:hypothetical protein